MLEEAIVAAAKDRPEDAGNHRREKRGSENNALVYHPTSAFPQRARNPADVDQEGRLALLHLILGGCGRAGRQKPRGILRRPIEAYLEMQMRTGGATAIADFSELVTASYELTHLD